MSKKHNLEYAKSAFSACNHKLQATEYKNVKTKMKCQCPLGHDAFISLHEILRRQRQHQSCKCQCVYSDTFLTLEKLVFDIREKVIPNITGDFPTREEMRQLDFGIGYNFERAVCKFGGYNKLRLAVGANVKKQSNNYWKNWSNIENEIKNKFPVHIAKGICPSYIELRTSGVMVDTISRNFGGLPNVADKLSCKLASVYKCRDKHYAESIYECMLDEYLYSRHIKHTIHPPIDKQYYADFGIDDKYFIEIWGYRPNDTGKIGTFYNNKRRKKEQVYKTLPQQLIFFECDLFEKSLKNLQIFEQHLDDTFASRGYDVAKKEIFDLETITSAGDVWCELSVKNSIQEIIDKIGHFPSLKELKENGLESAVCRFGGITCFRTLMGHTDDINDHRSLHTKWTDDIVLNRLKEWVKKLSRMPKQKELLKIDVNLLCGITACGGLEKFKAILGLQVIKPRNYWTEEKILSELRQIGYVPSQKDLRKTNSQLEGAVTRFGGFKKFKSLLNSG